jgi:hypothetical protein
MGPFAEGFQPFQAFYDLVPTHGDWGRHLSRTHTSLMQSGCVLYG